MQRKKEVIYTSELQKTKKKVFHETAKDIEKLNSLDLMDDA